VGLYSATEEQSLSFHQFEQGTHKRVRNKRVAERTDSEVDYDDIVKGCETSGGEHVMVTQDELDSVAPESSRSLSIDDFVELAEIDPIYYQKTYYLAPRDEEDEHAYALLREATDEAGLAGIATLVMRYKEYLAAIRALDEVLVLNTMYFADEVREPSDTVGRLPDRRDVPKKELDAALCLVREMKADWGPAHYHDTHREQVLKLVEQKAKGKEPDVEAAPESEDNVIDLMSALQESIDRARNGRKRGSDERSEMSKKELYERAGDLGVSGRSKMSKDELEEAVANAS
jgi:DNA end-binding protein Ku